MSYTLVSSAAILAKAGQYAYVGASSGAILKELADQAEGEVCSKTRYDWITNYASLNASFKPMLAAAVSDKAALMYISYGMPNYSKTAEATAMMDVLRDDYQGNIDALKDAEVRRAMGVN